MIEDWRAHEGDVAALLSARHGDPFRILGLHVTPAGAVVRAFVPGADSLAVVDGQNAVLGELEARGGGFFEGLVTIGRAVSHDEVVHGKRSILDKMPGDRWQRFANARAYYGFMWAHPGKKLLFMGGEFGQGAEWSDARSLDWHLTHQAEHAGLQALVRDLNHRYRDTPALHARDCEPEGFHWLVVDDRLNSVLGFLRLGGPDDPPVAVLSNFTPVPRGGYRVGLPRAGRWREVLNTDAAAYAGSGAGNMGGVDAFEVPWNGFPASAEVFLPPLATVYFEFGAP